MKVYILFESDRGESEIQKVVSSKKKAIAWTKEKFEKEARQERLIEPDEKLDFDLIPDMWKFPRGYSTNYYTVYYEEHYVE